MNFLLKRIFFSARYSEQKWRNYMYGFMLMLTAKMSFFANCSFNSAGLVEPWKMKGALGR
jgi:hypothetical protein